MEMALFLYTNLKMLLEIIFANQESSGNNLHRNNNLSIGGKNLYKNNNNLSNKRVNK